MIVNYIWDDNDISKTDAGMSLVEDIEYALDVHHFDMFMNLREKHTNDIKLPSIAFIKFDDGHIGRLDITNRDNFRRITNHKISKFLKNFDEKDLTNYISCGII